MCWIVVELTGIPAHATELKPETAAAYDRYIHAVEARMEDDARTNRFLVIDRLPDSRRRNAYEQLQQGQIYIAQQYVRDGNRPIQIPNGLIHHWAGVVFIPNATLDEAIVVLRDYNRHKGIFRSDIRESKLIEQNGNEAKIFLQLFNKRIVTSVLDANFDVTDTQLGPARFQIACRSTRIAEVVDEGKPDEHEDPVGNDHGYVWRLNTYWRIKEMDGGVYIQNETVSLSRTVPPMMAWLINPVLRKIPRDILFRLMTEIRTAIEMSESPSRTAQPSSVYESPWRPAGENPSAQP